MVAPELLLGEWACLGLLQEGPAHGYALAKRVEADGDLGRVWTMSRAMVYRCLDVLVDNKFARSGETVVDGGPPRTLFKITAAGTRALHQWLDEPVTHLRDVRSELLIKLLIASNLGRDTTILLGRQLELADTTHQRLAAAAKSATPTDPVAIWRVETAAALRRTIVRLLKDVSR